MAEMDEVPVGHAAIDRGVSAHRRDDDAVGQLEGTDPKRCKQRAHANFSFFMWNRLVGVGWVTADAIFHRARPFGAGAETLPNTTKYEAPRQRKGGVVGVDLRSCDIFAGKQVWVWPRGYF